MTDNDGPLDVDDIRTLVDKDRIQRLSADYMHALDRLDVAALKDVFFSDANVDYGFFAGGAHAFCETAIPMLSSFDKTHHMIGQARIDLEGDVAFGEVYLQAMHRSREGEVENDFIVWGRYVDRYERRDGVWKIAFRAEIFDFVRNQPASDDWFKENADALRGARGDQDWSRQRTKLRTL